MPMHDWTRVSAGTYHAFHNAWITHLQEALNAGLLPDPYYALGEQQAGCFGPDVLALKAVDSEAPERLSATPGEAMVAVAEAPPQVRITQEAAEDVAYYLERQRAVMIRHATGDRIVAMIEIVSQANRHSAQTLNDFVGKIIASLQQGIHLVVIDPFPGGRHDPDGIHGLVWERLLAGNYSGVEGQPLTLVSYTAGHPIKAWIEPLCVGTALTSMPLFLTTTHYIPLPLEETYTQSWVGVPERWKRVIVPDVSQIDYDR